MKLATTPASKHGSFTGEALDLGMAPEGTQLRTEVFRGGVTLAVFVIGHILVEGFKFKFLRDRSNGISVTSSTHVTTDCYVKNAAAARGLAEDAIIWANDMEADEKKSKAEEEE